MPEIQERYDSEIFILLTVPLSYGELTGHKENALPRGGEEYPTMQYENRIHPV